MEYMLYPLCFILGGLSWGFVLFVVMGIINGGLVVLGNYFFSCHGDLIFLLSWGIIFFTLNYFKKIVVREFSENVFLSGIFLPQSPGEFI
jgi:hypothetical protein